MQVSKLVCVLVCINFILMISAFRVKSTCEECYHVVLETSSEYFSSVSCQFRYRIHSCVAFSFNFCILVARWKEYANTRERMIRLVNV